MASSNGPRQKGGPANKGGTSHHTVRGSPGASAKDTRPSTAPTRTTQTQSTKRPTSSTPGQSSGSVKKKEPVLRSAVEQKAKKIAFDNADAESDKKKAEWENEKDDLQRSLEEEKHKTKTIETFWENKMKALKEKNESDHQRMREKIEKLEESLSKGQEDNKVLQNKYNQLEHNTERVLKETKTEWEKKYKKLTKNHTNETEQLHKTIKSLTVEKDNLLTRLSTIASDRLTHENVNIADLSDADRPTKLQEMYSELYDNEWTDAFEELITHNKFTENDAIMMLLKILMSSFQNCREITWGRYERLKNVASSVYIEEEISMPSPKVMSNVSELVLTTQEAGTSRALIHKNDKDVDQTSDTDNNLDTMQDGTASRESGEKNEMHVMNEKAFKVNGAKKNVAPGDPHNGARDNEASNDQTVSEAPKDKSEKNNKKNDVHDNKAPDDQSMSETPKDKSEKNNRKNDAHDNKAPDDQSESETPKDKSEKNNRKNDAHDNKAPNDQIVSETPKDKSEKNNRKNDAHYIKAPDDQSESEAPEDKSEKNNRKHLQCTIDLNIDHMHAIKGIWRKTTLELKEIAAEKLYTVIKKCPDMPFNVQPMTSNYLKKCIDLCFKMGVQERPLHLDGFAEMNAYAGKKFDKDMFRAYTRSGSHITFVVWPTLYLYEGGPILVKGIVQCCSPAEATNEKPSKQLLFEERRE